jgi:cholesterol oxidase
VTVHDGEDDSAPVCGKGILHIRPADFAKQMTTMQIPNATSAKQRLETLAQFGKFFAGAVWESYGPIGSDLVKIDDKPPRKKRPLDAPTPVVHYFATEDGAELRLTRYEGGTKGPVICAPGFGNNVLPFDFDGIETNTAEYLCAHGYDTWLFDYRASPSLPVSKTQFTIDDIARYDWPAAVAKVREVTGAESVQTMNHCMGSMTCFMALLTGLEGVRSFVSSQLTAHCDAEFADKLKAGIHLEKWIELAGLDGITTDPGEDAMGKLVDQLLKLYPMPRDWAGLNKACHRIYAMYGHVFKPENLNQATHDAQQEMFGFGNITAFDQIMHILRAGHIVDKDGNDVYLPNVEKLRLPISIIHGEDNIFFKPSGSQKTYTWLRENNGTEFYTRTVIPNYAHLDCFIGKDAAHDVFPTIVAELDKYN